MTGNIVQRRGLRLYSMAGVMLAATLLTAVCGGEEETTRGPAAVAAPTEAQPPDSGQPKRGGTLRVAVVRDHSTFDPPIVVAVPDIVFTRQSYDNLILRDPDDLSLAPMLAESWEQNGDLTQFTFRLRPGVKFRHGKEFTAEDVVYTFNRLLDPDVGSPIAATLDFVKNVAALDERTVVFDLDSPNAYLPDLVTLYHARIIPSDIHPERLVTEEFGTGPFFLKEHVEDERIVMTRNAEYWWEGYPYLDGVIFFYIPDPETRTGALTTGVVDVIHDLVPSSVPALDADPETRVSEAASAAYLSLAMDMRVPPFDNILVRKALQAATDREAILQVAQFGKGEIAYDHPIPSNDPLFWEGSRDAASRYDIERAEALLEEAGYPDGIDLTLYTSTSVATMVEMAVVFKEKAAPAGIRVKIQREPEENYWTDVWMVKPFTTAWWGGRAPEEALSVAYKSDAEWNESRYENPRVDELIIKARSQADRADRRESYWEIQRTLIDEVPRIIPVFGPVFRGLRLNVRDCEANQKSKLLLYKCWLDD